MKAIQAALRESILNNDPDQLGRIVEHGRSLGMNHYDLLSAAEEAVPGLDAEEWADRMEEVAAWES